MVIQPMTIFQFQKFNKIIPISTQITNYPFKIVHENRKECFNEATKSQHIASDHFANSKHGYSRVVGGAMSID